MMKKGLKCLAIGGLVGILGSGVNIVYNNRTIDKVEYHSEISTTSLINFVNFTQYPDGSRDIKKYNFCMLTEKFIDSNFDGLIDIIESNNGTFLRQFDYFLNEQKFKTADDELKKLVKKYSTMRD